jgi:gluconate kinase
LFIYSRDFIYRIHQLVFPFFVFFALDANLAFLTIRVSQRETTNSMAESLLSSDLNGLEEIEKTDNYDVVVMDIEWLAKSFLDNSSADGEASK